MFNVTHIDIKNTMQIPPENKTNVIWRLSLMFFQKNSCYDMLYPINPPIKSYSMLQDLEHLELYNSTILHVIIIDQYNNPYIYITIQYNSTNWVWIEYKENIKIWFNYQNLHHNTQPT